MTSTPTSVIDAILNPVDKYCRDIHEALVEGKHISHAFAAKHHLSGIRGINVRGCLAGIARGVHKEAQRLREEGEDEQADEMLRKLGHLLKH